MKKPDEEQNIARCEKSLALEKMAQNVLQMEPSAYQKLELWILIADNLAKAKALPIINQCHTCKQGSYHLNQTAFDKLVETVKIIDMQNDDADGLTALTASGLLNEETLELFAANPYGFQCQQAY